MNHSILPYIVATMVVTVGLYAVVCKRNVIKIIIGIIILDYGVNLFLVLTGYRTDGIAPILSRDMDKSELMRQSVDPVPQALILTSIVIGLGIVALMTAMAIRIYEKHGTFDLSEIRDLKG